MLCSLSTSSKISRITMLSSKDVVVYDFVCAITTFQRSKLLIASFYLVDSDMIIPWFLTNNTCCLVYNALNEIIDPIGGVAHHSHASQFVVSFFHLFNLNFQNFCMHHFSEKTRVFKILFNFCTALKKTQYNYNKT